MKMLLTAIALSMIAIASSASLAQDSQPSREWTDEQIHAAVNKVRAGRDLSPASWPGGARVAVMLSFDVDNETIWLAIFY